MHVLWLLAKVMDWVLCIMKRVWNLSYVFHPVVLLLQMDEIMKKYPTPFHLYDEKGIRKNMQALKEAFAWNPGYKEYFAVKATPNPFLIDILREYGCGCDCSSYTELLRCYGSKRGGHYVFFQ